MCVEEEDIKEELVDHLKVTQHLELAGRLILKGEKLECLSAYHTHRHTEQHYPIDKRKYARIEQKGLVKHDHRCRHENRLHYIGPGRQRLHTRLFHFAQGDRTHTDKDRVEYEKE